MEKCAQFQGLFGNYAYFTIPFFIFTLKVKRQNFQRFQCQIIKVNLSFKQISEENIVKISA